MAENPRPWIRAAVRYWGGALSLVDDPGKQRPGFNYTPAERQIFSTLCEKVSPGELGLFLLLDSLIFIGLAGAVVMAGFIPLIKALYPVAQHTPVLAICVILGVICAIMAGIGLPLSIVLSAGLLGKLFRHPEKTRDLSGRSGPAVSEGAVAVSALGDAGDGAGAVGGGGDGDLRGAGDGAGADGAALRAAGDWGGDSGLSYRAAGGTQLSRGA